MSFKGDNNNLQITKRKLVDNEDIIFNSDDLNKFYTTATRNESTPVDFYNNGIKRKVYYYPDVDIYKMQANWTRKSSDESYLLGL